MKLTICEQLHSLFLRDENIIVSRKLINGLVWDENISDTKRKKIERERDRMQMAIDGALTDMGQGHYGSAMSTLNEFNSVKPKSK